MTGPKIERYPTWTNIETPNATVCWNRRSCRAFGLAVEVEHQVTSCPSDSLPGVVVEFDLHDAPALQLAECLIVGLVESGADVSHITRYLEGEEVLKQEAGSA